MIAEAPAEADVLRPIGCRATHAGIGRPVTDAAYHRMDLPVEGGRALTVGELARPAVRASLRPVHGRGVGRGHLRPEDPRAGAQGRGAILPGRTEAVHG